MQEFKRRDALDRLLPFLDADNISERSAAACATITIAPERAIKTLEEIVASRDRYEFSNAYDALDHYRRGQTVVSGSVEGPAPSVAGGVQGRVDSDSAKCGIAPRNTENRGGRGGHCRRRRHVRRRHARL